MRAFYLMFAALFMSVSLCECAHAALTVAGYSSERHDRFANSAGFVGNAYDWSGVGRDQFGTWGTLISPSYVVSSAHLAASGTLRFYLGNDPAGSYIERAVAAGMQVAGSDLYLARLGAPINAGSGITSYEIATYQGTSYLDREMFTFGKAGGVLTTQADQRLGRNQIDELRRGFSDPALGPTVGDAIFFDYDPVNGFVPDEALVQGGDSGAPSFAIVSNKPALTGLHWFRYDPDAMYPTAGSGDTFVSSYVDELNLAMLQLTPIGQPAETVRTANVAAVPEPSAFALSILGLAALHTGGRFLRRRQGMELRPSVSFHE